MAAVVHREPRLGMLNPAPGAELEVWGDPVAHSRSPDIHGAAYATLGLDWTYGRRRVSEAGFAQALADSTARGLSLTYPLKQAAFDAADERDRRAGATGAVNTLLRADGRLRGFNTDVGGIVRDLADHGVTEVAEARIVGGGATATSALAALAERGAARVQVVARRPEALAGLVARGERLGVAVHPASLADAWFPPVALTVAALPGGAEVGPRAAAALAASGGVLYDVVYGHWPTALGAAWQRAGRTAVAGLGMLVQQALLQVRVFVAGDVDTALPGEDAVLAAMRAALVGPAVTGDADMGD